MRLSRRPHSFPPHNYLRRMSTVRKQTIISSLLIYIGFAFGALNTYLFAKQGLFTAEQYGLTRAFIVMGQFFFGFASLGLTPVIIKFFPYYRDNLPKQKDDLLTLCLLVAVGGFILTLCGGLFFESLVVKKFIEKSPLIVKYYYWIFPYTFFLLFFSLLEAYAWSIGKTIIPNFLREAGFRIATTLLIIFFIFTGKNFDLFIKIFSFLYGFTVITIVAYLIWLKQFYFVLHISRVTKKFWKKMLTLMSFLYGGALISVAASSVDFLAIASFKGLSMGAVFDFSAYIANVIQVPQRSLVSIAYSILSRAWKDKDFAAIDRLYKRSSLNLLLISLLLFSIIWLNYDDAIATLGLNPIFAQGKWVVFLLAMRNIIDMGTGVNSQIIGTSLFWRFEFFSGLVLLVLIIPLNVILVKHYGIIGSAWSNLLSYIVYNTVRIVFLKRKFNLQPFTWGTLRVIFFSGACFFVTYYLFIGLSGWIGIMSRSIFFAGIFITGVLYLHLTPDAAPVWATLRKRLRF